MSKDEERSGAAGAAEDASSLRAVDTRAMPQGGRARLVEIMGGHPGKAHYLDADGTLIGRDDEVDIRLPGTEVSRRHARIWCGEADVWQVEDLGSRNGILINGLPAAQSKLCFGDQLQFGGQTLFIFTQHEQLEDLVSNVQRMETLGILAGGVAHDFNNLLSVLVTNIDFLQEHHGPRPLDEATLQECLSEMRVATEEAETLIRRLLRYARPSQGVVVEDVNCTALVTDITGLCRRTFGPTITWAVTNDGEAWVRGDRGELGQIIMNLLINARDAMPRGGKIGVHIHQDRLHADLVASGGTHSGEYIRLDISDTGVGMAPGTRDHIFEPFFTTKGAQKGTGMGLATVQALVHGHGGQVRVESVEGQGTTFSVYLPALASDAKSISETLPVAESVGDAAEVALFGGRPTILLVDDDDAVRRTTGRLLRDMGCRVYSAADGEAGYSLFAAHHEDISLVILDLVMPFPDGRETLDRLRSYDAGVPVLLLSGQIDEATARLLVARGADAVLEKPCRATSLRAAIDAALN